MRRVVNRSIETLLGRELRDHRVPFGPIAGSYLRTRPTLSLRMYLGMAEPAVARLIGRIVAQGDTVYDVGAHIGYLTVLFARCVGSAGRVEAFELLPGTAAILQSTIELNGLEQCAVHAVGLSDGERTNRTLVNAEAMGTAEFSAGAEVEGPVEICRVVMLDRHRAEHGLAAPTLIKIDVEGGEVRALRGAAETIRESEPLLIVELHGPLPALDSLTWLAEAGYNVATVDGAPVDVRSIARLGPFPCNVLAWRDIPQHRERVER